MYSINRYRIWKRFCQPTIKTHSTSSLNLKEIPIIILSFMMLLLPEPDIFPLSRQKVNVKHTKYLSLFWYLKRLICIDVFIFKEKKKLLLYPVTNRIFLQSLFNFFYSYDIYEAYVCKLCLTVVSRATNSEQTWLLFRQTLEWCTWMK